MEEENIIIQLLLQTIIELDKPQRRPKNALVKKYLTFKNEPRYLSDRIYYNEKGEEVLSKGYNKHGKITQRTRMMYPNSNTYIRESTDKGERNLWVKVFQNKLLTYEYFIGNEVYISYQSKNQINRVSENSDIEDEGRGYYQFYYEHGELNKVEAVWDELKIVKSKIFNKSITERQIDFYNNQDWLERSIVLTKNTENQLIKKFTKTFDSNKEIEYSYFDLYNYYPNKKIKTVSHYSTDIKSKEEWLESTKQFNSKGLEIVSTTFDKNGKITKLVETTYEKRKGPKA